jgi:hypothetical protein
MLRDLRNRPGHRTTLFIATILTALSLIPVKSAFAQGSWIGQVQCQLAIQANGSAHTETQTWTLTGGPPTLQGAIEVYPATWSVSGEGSQQRTVGVQLLASLWKSTVPGISAPIGIFVRASDNRLVIKSMHAQVSQAGAISGTRQMTAGAQPTAMTYTAFEWPLPPIEDTAAATTVSGSANETIAATFFPQALGNPGGAASCKWQFTKGTPARTGGPAVSVIGTTIATSTTPARGPLTTVNGSLGTRTITLAGFTGAGVSTGVDARTITLNGFTGAGTTNPVTPRTITLPGWTGAGK